MTERLNSCLAAAKNYAASGWPVLPLHTPEKGGCSCGNPDCSSAGKHPRTRHGVKEATTNEQVIYRWWHEQPKANVGIATGESLLVVDVDIKHGGVESLQKLEQDFEPLPQTRSVITGSGGLHLYYQTEVEVFNRVNVSGYEGIDLRGKGGYVVAPPSLHQSGQLYEWKPTPVTLSEAPEWLIFLATPKEIHSCVPPQKEDCQGLIELEHYWLEQALKGAKEGKRNQLGFILACRLRDIGLSFHEARSVLEEYVERCPQGDRPYTRWEALASLRGVYKTPLGKKKE